MWKLCENMKLPLTSEANFSDRTCRCQSCQRKYRRKTAKNINFREKFREFTTQEFGKYRKFVFYKLQQNRDKLYI